MPPEEALTCRLDHFLFAGVCEALKAKKKRVFRLKSRGLRDLCLGLHGLCRGRDLESSSPIQID
ncbi:hypothetical protein L249_8381 [Ophiocordyceps polyrhachis-furcata BCC 54312]|uniref:Uncharacterized protein n=1 Tax=Ophiocordyceps polyrhachis-furcata BCC 54312 TaxID=1330021 RepID=A0A367L6U1_9HYPO|nr:hypothetical protein L249_8381 [Ophiocordyceps polyrhachis-furcata BCC 54312]